MYEILLAGGWVMIPLVLFSVASVGIIAERFWSLRTSRITPPALVGQVWQWYKANTLDDQRIETLSNNSPLGRILAVGLANRHHPREIMKETLQDVGRQVAHELERYLNTLGSIASLSTLLGLYGTVIGMIQAFNAIAEHGVGNPTVVATGIATALITTAAGLTVAIPTLFFYRYFRGKVNALTLRMEEEALKVVDIIHGEREASAATAKKKATS